MEGFAFGRHGALYEAHLVPNADRTVELFLALVEHLVPAVDVHLADARTGATWDGEALANGDVRDAIARSKATLATHAGTEVSITGGGEQLTLSANLELYAFARTDRWLYLLQGKGLQRVPRLRRRSWTLDAGEFRPLRPGEGSAGALIAARLGMGGAASAGA